MAIALPIGCAACDFGRRPGLNQHIVQCLQVASKHQGLIFGKHVYQRIVPTYLSFNQTKCQHCFGLPEVLFAFGSCDSSRQHICLWFKQLDSANYFVQEINHILTLVKANYIDSELRPNYQGKLEFEAIPECFQFCYKIKSTSCLISLIITKELPQDFNINQVWAIYTAQRVLLVNTHLNQEIAHQRVTILEPWLEKYYYYFHDDYPEYFTLSKQLLQIMRNKLIKFIEQGWQIKCQGSDQLFSKVSELFFYLEHEYQPELVQNPLIKSCG